MIIVMDDRATESQIENVVSHLTSKGFDIHKSTGSLKTVLGAIGDKRDIDIREFEILEGVQEVVRVTEPFKLVGRHFHPDNSVFDLQGVKIGGNEIIVMAGPCSIENVDQIEEIAALLAENGVKVLRGGAFKPRTSPYSFQGLGEEGLKMIRKAADRNDLLVVTELMDFSQVSLISEYTDIMQIGARNMQNYSIMKAVGSTNIPVFLKRGLSATIEEWLLSAEYIFSGGNDRVILCERGIRTFEKYTRNTFDVSAIPAAQQHSHLPVFADPSHAVGIRNMVIPMARAAIAAGADGIMVEVHTDPDKALSDGPQSLKPEQFNQMMKELRSIAKAVGRNIAQAEKETAAV